MENISVEKAREIRKQALKEMEEQRYHDVFLDLKKDTEEKIVDWASRGNSYCFTKELKNDISFITIKDPYKLKQYLQDEMQVTFGDTLGYKVDYIPAYNTMRISWEEGEKDD